MNSLIGGKLGSGEPLVLPENFLQQLAKNNDAGPISTAFMGLLDAQRNLFESELQQMRVIREQYESGT